LYSKRTGKVLATTVPDQRKLRFAIKRNFYPRLDGCEFEDTQFGDVLLIKRNSDDGEKTVSKFDLSIVDLEAVEWNINNEESSESDSEDQDEDYNDDENTLAKFIDKLAEPEAAYSEDNWKFKFHADKQTHRITLKAVTVKMVRVKKSV
jgi:hypothetical protein